MRLRFLAPRFGSSSIGEADALVRGAERFVSLHHLLGGAMGYDEWEDLPRLFRAETVRGDPYEVGGRVLTPEARIVSFGKARGTVGQRVISGWMFGFTRVLPLAIVEDTDAGTRRIEVVDATANALTGLLVVAVAITLFFSAVGWAARRVRDRGT